MPNISTVNLPDVNHVWQTISGAVHNAVDAASGGYHHLRDSFEHAHENTLTWLGINTSNNTGYPVSFPIQFIERIIYLLLRFTIFDTVFVLHEAVARSGEWLFATKMRQDRYDDRNPTWFDALSWQQNWGTLSMYHLLRIPGHILSSFIFGAAILMLGTGLSLHGTRSIDHAWALLINKEDRTKKYLKNMLSGGLLGLATMGLAGMLKLTGFSKEGLSSIGMGASAASAWLFGGNYPETKELWRGSLVGAVGGGAFVAGAALLGLLGVSKESAHAIRAICQLSSQLNAATGTKWDLTEFSSPDSVGMVAEYALKTGVIGAGVGGLILSAGLLCTVLGFNARGLESVNKAFEFVTSDAVKLNKDYAYTMLSGGLLGVITMGSACILTSLGFSKAGMMSIGIGASAASAWLFGSDYPETKEFWRGSLVGLVGGGAFVAGAALLGLLGVSKESAHAIRAIWQLSSQLNTATGTKWDLTEFSSPDSVGMVAEYALKTGVIGAGVGSLILSAGLLCTVLGFNARGLESVNKAFEFVTSDAVKLNKDYAYTMLSGGLLGVITMGSACISTSVGFSKAGMMSIGTGAGAASAWLFGSDYPETKEFWRGSLVGLVGGGAFVAGAALLGLLGVSKESAHAIRAIWQLSSQLNTATGTKWDLTEFSSPDSVRMVAKYALKTGVIGAGVGGLILSVGLLCTVFGFNPRGLESVNKAFKFITEDTVKLDQGYAVTMVNGGLLGIVAMGSACLSTVLGFSKDGMISISMGASAASAWLFGGNYPETKELWRGSLVGAVGGGAFVAGAALLGLLGVSKESAHAIRAIWQLSSQLNAATGTKWDLTEFSSPDSNRMSVEYALKTGIIGAGVGGLILSAGLLCTIFGFNPRGIEGSKKAYQLVIKNTYSLDVNEILRGGLLSIGATCIAYVLMTFGISKAGIMSIGMAAKASYVWLFGGNYPDSSEFKQGALAGVVGGGVFVLGAALLGLLGVSKESAHAIRAIWQLSSQLNTATGTKWDLTEFSSPDSVKMVAEYALKTGVIGAGVGGLILSSGLLCTVFGFNPRGLESVNKAFKFITEDTVKLDQDYAITMVNGGLLGIVAMGSACLSTVLGFSKDGMISIGMGASAASAWLFGSDYPETKEFWRGSLVGLVGGGAFVAGAALLGLLGVSKESAHAIRAIWQLSSQLNAATGTKWDLTEFSSPDSVGMVAEYALKTGVIGASVGSLILSAGLLCTVLGFNARGLESVNKAFEFVTSDAVKLNKDYAYTMLSGGLLGVITMGSACILTSLGFSKAGMMSIGIGASAASAWLFGSDYPETKEFWRGSLVGLVGGGAFVAGAALLGLLGVSKESAHAIRAIWQLSSQLNTATGTKWDLTEFSSPDSVGMVAEYALKTGVIGAGVGSLILSAGLLCTVLGFNARGLESVNKAFEFVTSDAVKLNKDYAYTMLSGGLLGVITMGSACISTSVGFSKAGMMSIGMGAGAASAWLFGSDYPETKEFWRGSLVGLVGGGAFVAGAALLGLLGISKESAHAIRAIWQLSSQLNTATGTKWDLTEFSSPDSVRMVAEYALKTGVIGAGVGGLILSVGLLCTVFGFNPRGLESVKKAYASIIGDDVKLDKDYVYTMINGGLLGVATMGTAAILRVLGLSSAGWEGIKEGVTAAKGYLTGSIAEGNASKILRGSIISWAITAGVFAMTGMIGLVANEKSHHLYRYMYYFFPRTDEDQQNVDTARQGLLNVHGTWGEGIKNINLASIVLAGIGAVASTLLLCLYLVAVAISAVCRITGRLSQSKKDTTTQSDPNAVLMNYRKYLTTHGDEVNQLDEDTKLVELTDHVRTFAQDHHFLTGLLRDVWRIFTVYQYNVPENVVQELIKLVRSHDSIEVSPWILKEININFIEINEQGHFDYVPPTDSDTIQQQLKRFFTQYDISFVKLQSRNNETAKKLIINTLRGAGTLFASNPSAINNRDIELTTVKLNPSTT